MEPRKRKISEEEESQQNISKIFKKAFNEDFQYSLEHFCDEILLVVLNYLDSESLYNLDKTCERFSFLVQEKKLWNDVSYMNKPLTVSNILKRLEFLQITTESLKLRGDYSKKNSPPTTKQSFKSIISKISFKCSLLHTLHFQDVWFDWVQHFRITEFPCTLQSLIFINCNSPKTKRRLREPKIFTGMDHYMTNLTELRIEYCTWFEVHDIVQFSKLPSLKSLSLKGCSKLVNCVPYLSLACRFGFKTLENLDMRDTYINDSDLQCFNVLTKLKELYLECPKKEKPPESSSDDDTDDDFENIQNRFIATYRDRTENPSESDAPGGSVPGSSTVIVAAPMAEASGSSARLSVSLPVPEIQITHGDPNDNPVAVNSDNEQPIPSTSRAANTDSSTDSSMSDSSTSAEDMESNSAFSAIVIRNYQNGNNASNGSRNSVNSPNNLLNQNNEPRMEPRMHISINNNFRIRDLAVPRLMPLEVPAIRLMMVGENNYPHARYLRYGRDLPQFRQASLLSDRGILGFGIAAPQILQDVVFIRIQQRDPNTYIEKLVVRNYKNVTDISLKHLVNTAPKLVYLDVTGTGVTPEGVADFKSRKPDCTIITAFDEE